MRLGDQVKYTFYFNRYITDISQDYYFLVKREIQIICCYYIIHHILYQRSCFLHFALNKLLLFLCKEELKIECETAVVNQTRFMKSRDIERDSLKSGIKERADCSKTIEVGVYQDSI